MLKTEMVGMERVTEISEEAGSLGRMGMAGGVSARSTNSNWTPIQ